MLGITGNAVAALALMGLEEPTTACGVTLSSKAKSSPLSVLVRLQESLHRATAPLWSFFIKDPQTPPQAPGHSRFSFCYTTGLTAQWGPAVALCSLSLLPLTALLSERLCSLESRVLALMPVYVALVLSCVSAHCALVRHCIGHCPYSPPGSQEDLPHVPVQSVLPCLANRSSLPVCLFKAIW